MGEQDRDAKEGRVERRGRDRDSDGPRREDDAAVRRPERGSRIDRDGQVEGSRRTVDRTWILSTIEWAIRSETRLDILGELRDAARELDDLQNAVPVHRTTLRRNLQDLCQRDLIEEHRDGKAYRLSRTGSVFVDAIEEMVDTVQSRYRLATFLDEFPRSVPVDLHRARDCRVTGPDSGDPYAPMFRLNSLLSGTSAFSMFTPAFGLPTARILATKVANAKDIEVLLAERVAEELHSDCLDILHTIGDAAVATIRLVPEGPAYGIVLLDRDTVLIASDESGRIVSILETSDPALREWATQRCRELRARAAPYEPKTRR